MRSILRVGAPAAVLGCLSMYLIAHAAGLVVAPALIALGIVTGLAMAKWLEWSWFGRQLEAGFKAGVVACIPAGLVALVALLVQGPHDLAQLEGMSHAGSLSVERLVAALGFGGWVTADLLGVVLAVALGAAAASVTTVIAAWSKSARTVQKVAQAHEAAQALRRGTWGPAPTSQVPAFPSSLAAGSAWQGMNSQPLPSPAPAWDGPARHSAPPAVDTAVKNGSAPNPRPTPIPAAPPANTPTTDEELRAAMREALAMWGEESGETAAVSAGGDGSAAAEAADQPTVRRKRNPKASQFLNDAKKKGRKKTDTRDWLC